MIRFQNISKIYPEQGEGQGSPSDSDGGSYNADTVALDNVSFDVDPKEFVCLVGKSGAGKTTLLKLLMAEESPTKGRVFFENQDVHKIKPAKLPALRKQIGAVFQDYKLLSSKTAYENIAYVMEVTDCLDGQIRQDVPKILEIVGLSNKANNFPAQLSGGEKQRVAIARALVHRPKVILADEPTGNLDPYNTLDIIKLLLKINEFGTTVILSTHNKEIINSLGKRVITLQDGKVIRDEKKGRFVI